MAEMRIRIGDLKKDAEDARTQMSKMQTQHSKDKKALESAVRQKHNAAEEYRQKSENLSVQVNQLSLEYGQLQNAYNLAVQGRETAVAEREDVKGDLDTEKDGTKRLADENQKLTDENRKLADENTRLSEGAANNASAYKLADDQLKHVQSVSDGNLRDLTQAQQALGSVQGELTTAQQRAAGLEQNVAELRGQLQYAQQAIGPAVDAARLEAIKKTTIDTLNVILTVLQGADQVGDGSALKLSFAGVLRTLVSSQIYDETEFAQMNHGISSAIDLAVQSSSQRLVLAQQAYASGLACTAAVVSAQATEEDMAEVDGSTDEQDLVNALHEAMRELQGLRADKTTLTARLHGVEEQNKLGEEKLMAVSDSILSEIKRRGPEDDIRRALNKRAEARPSEQDYYAISEGANLDNFFAERFQGAEFRVDLLRFLPGHLEDKLDAMAQSESKLHAMAKSFGAIVRAFCKKGGRKPAAQPLFSCDQSGIDRFYRWVDHEIVSTMVAERRRATERRLSLRSLQKKKIRPNPGPVPAVRESPAFGASSASPACVQYALGKYFEVQRLVLACVMYAARARAISRAASPTLGAFGKETLPPLGGRPVRKRAFV
jgi:myosin heavy subunit